MWSLLSSFSLCSNSSCDLTILNRRKAMLKAIPGIVWTGWADDYTRTLGTDMAESTYKIWIYCTWIVNMVCNICNPILELQVDLRLLKMVPNDFRCPRTSGFMPNSSSKVETLLEVVLGLLQPYPVLDLQIELRLLKMVPNDSSYLKPRGLTPKSGL